MVANASPAADRLRRILEVEQQRGCQNTAVMGGLDKLLHNMVAQVPPGDGPLAGVLRSLDSRSYADLPIEQRRAWLGRALAILTGRSDTPAPQSRRPSPGPLTPGIGGTAMRTRGPLTPDNGGTTTRTRVQAPPFSGVGGPGLTGRGAAPPPKPAHAPRKTIKPLSLDDSITALPGIGSGRAELLGRLGIERVRDLLYHFPHRHDDYSRIVPIAQLQVGEQQTIVATIWSAQAVQIGRSPRKSTELIVGDESGNMQVVFFNNPYPAQSLRTNQRVTLSGRVSVYHGMPQLQNPEWEAIEEGGELDRAIHTGRLVPVYPLTSGVLNRSMRQYIRAAVDACADQLEDPLPEAVRRQHGYLDLPAAIRQIHYPDDAETLEAARLRLAYEELLTLQLSVLARRLQRTSSLHATPLPLPETVRDAFFAALPFPLTGAQRRIIDAIGADLQRETPMARLLQGDVGSGKTVVAAAGLLAAAANGYQSVIMAPTEILAEQHFRTLCSLFGGGEEWDGSIMECRPEWLDGPLRVALLRGSLRARAKRRVQEAIELGLVQVAVGTQALIQGAVSFKQLGLTVVDEQHRFGVSQRSALAGKGDNTHLLVMTATPIPRTLALSVYGDLDISVLNEMPPGRKPVSTRIVPATERAHAYRFVRDQIEEGYQAFVICPLVEESEAIEVRAATEEYERLHAEVFPDLPISLLHGRMAPAEKDAVMQEFREGMSKILVSTAVVEVGIDVPQATVIMIEGAERFGLAQLHQFRGRVGRAGQQSYCLLLSDSASDESMERLRLLEQTGDGLKLAEEDLKLRGPGDYFGTRQSGMPALRQARISDTGILELARADANAILTSDPLLERPDHAALGRRVTALAGHAGEAN